MSLFHVHEKNEHLSLIQNRFLFKQFFFFFFFGIETQTLIEKEIKEYKGIQKTKPLKSSSQKQIQSN